VPSLILHPFPRVVPRETRFRRGGGEEIAVKLAYFRFSFSAVRRQRGEKGKEPWGEVSCRGGTVQVCDYFLAVREKSFT